MMSFGVPSNAAAFVLLFLDISTLALVHATQEDGGAATSSGTTSGFYTAYSKYPDYCAIPEVMKERRIPPLRDNDSRLGETRLVHVTSLVRHGARTPVDGSFSCWEGYWENPATGVWDCDLTLEEAPPTPQHEMDQAANNNNNNGISGNSDAVVLFEKHYDALMHPKDSLSNHLNGTCQTGQLLLQGYEQQKMNGEFLREAYFYDSQAYNHDVRLRLFDVTEEEPWASPHFYLRADDDQRTQLSGEILTRAMFEPEIEKAAQIQKGTYTTPRIPIHLADRDRDVLDGYQVVCPRLREIRDNVEKSSDFRSFNNSKEAQELRTFTKQQLGSNVDLDVFNCIMPTICTDRPLPDAFDYERSSDVLDRMAKFYYELYNRHLTENDAEFSKLAFGPVWAEIMDNINPIVNEEDHHPPNRMAVFSGHDTTIQMFLASLGLLENTQWPPYASMILLEIHEIIDGETDRSVFASKFAFRIIFNGQTITDQLEGCLNDAELCDVKILTDLVAPFAKRDRNCDTSKSFMSTNTGGSGNAVSSGAFHSFLLVLLGGLLGVVATWYYLTGSLSCKTRHKRLGYSTTSSTLNEGGASLPPAYSDDPGANRYVDEPHNNGGLD